jgi:hypothetical protein
MMAYSMRRPGLALWGAWLGAGVVGSLLPVLPAALNLRFPIVADLRLDDAYGLRSAAVGAICLALFQTIVLGVLKARFTASVLMWIPVSTGATVVAYLAIALGQVTVPRAVISVSAIQASLPPSFPLLQVIFALSSVAVAVVVGVAQGILLARVFRRRSALGLWLVANLVAAVLVGIVFGIRLQEPVTGSDADLTAIFLSTTLIDGALYAAVTGAALVAFARRRTEVSARDQA